MTHDETYQTDKFDNLLMLVTGGTNYTMAEEHLLYRKALSAIVELHKPKYMGCGEDNCCGPDMCECGDTLPCPTIVAIEEHVK